MNKERAAGTISLLLATFLWSFWGILARLLGSNIGTFYQGFARGMILLAILLICVLLKKSWRKVEKADLKWFLIIGVSGLFSVAGHFIAFNNLGISTVYFYSYAAAGVGSYFLGKFLFGEKITKIKFIALILCLVGLLMVFSSTMSKGNIYFVLLALMAGLCSSAWGNVSKKITKKYSLTQVVLVDGFIFTVGCLFFSRVFGEAVLLPVLSMTWLYVVIFSLLVLVATFFHFYGLKYIQAQIGVLITLLEVVFASFFGWLFFKETLTLFSLIGGVMIIFGAVLPNLFTNDKHKLVV